MGKSIKKNEGNKRKRACFDRVLTMPLRGCVPPAAAKQLKDVVFLSPIIYLVNRIDKLQSKVQYN